MARQPRFDLAVLVPDAVVHDQVQIQVGWRLLVDLAQEVQERLVSMVLANAPLANAPLANRRLRHVGCDTSSCSPIAPGEIPVAVISTVRAPCAIACGVYLERATFSSSAIWSCCRSSIASARIWRIAASDHQCTGAHARNVQRNIATGHEMLLTTPVVETCERNATNDGGLHVIEWRLDVGQQMPLSIVQRASGQER